MTTNGPDRARRRPVTSRCARLAAAGLAAVSLAALPTAAGAAEAPVGLGTAQAFALLAGSEVTNTGPSTINGDLGLFPGTAVTGFDAPGATVNGTQHVGDEVAANAKADLATAYTDAAGRAPSATVPPDLADLVLTPGVYRAPSALGLTGKVTLDAQGDPAAVFVFQVGSQLTTASASTVALVNGAQPCNVFWQVGSSATLGSGSVFVGSILALTSISLDDAVTVEGRTLARNGAVTLINDTITAKGCATPTSEVTPTPGTPATGGGPTTGGTPGSSTGSTGGSTTPTAGRSASSGGTARLTKRRVDGGTRVAVTGRKIRRVVFSRGGRVIGTRRGGPFAITVPRGGARRITARITYTDGTPPVTRRIRLAPTPAPRATPSRPPRAPGGFTG